MSSETQGNSKRLRLAYLISHGHTARGAFQTGLLDKLNETFDVQIIAKPDALEALAGVLNHSGIKIHSYDYKISRGDTVQSMLRAHVHQNIRKNPALWEKHLWRINSKKNSLPRRLMNKMYFYLGAFLRVFPGGRSLFSKLESSVYHRPDAQELLKNIGADIVLSTRPVDEMEVTLLESAQRLGIHKTFYILSWDNITSKGIFPVIGDTFLTWGPVMNDELKEYYQINESRIYNTGVTHFDIHFKVRSGELRINDLLSSMGLNDQKPYLLFTMSASYYAPTEIDIVEWLAEEVRNNSFGPDMQLVIRPHMANLMASRSDQSWLERLQNLKSDRVALDIPDSENSLLTWYMKQDDMVKLSNLIYGSAMCLNSGSTIAIEAAYLDRPVILTSFDTKPFPKWQSATRLLEYIHLEKFVSFGGCLLPKNLETLKTDINQYIQTPELQSAERKKTVEMECFKNDGKATDRFVENMNTIARNLNG
ncbi:MAG: hypothetical protein GC181_03600 [Bacteroidetes bacterium]|nr:hypothetical protein [Bacteroidota bacterium]